MVFVESKLQQAVLRLTRVSTGQILVFILGAFVALLVLYPLSLLVWGGFRSDVPYVPSNYSLGGYAKAFSQAATYQAFWTTLWLAAVRTAGAVGLAIFLAWMVHRTDTPGRHILQKLIYFRFFIPQMPIILAWILLFSKVGFVNMFLSEIVGVERPIFNVYSYAGIVLTSILGWSTLLFVFVSPAFQAMDARLEESSRMSGASGLGTLRRITIPLLSPAILAITILAFVRMMGSFESELFLGTPAGIYVFTTRIFWYTSGRVPPDFAAATALSNVLLLITLLIVVVQWKVLGRREYTTVSGRGYQARPMELGRWRYLTFAAVVVYLIIDLALPLGALVLGSFMKIWGVFTPGWFTLRNYTQVFHDAQFWGSLRNTVFMAGAAATSGMIVCSLVAYVGTRTNFAGRRFLDLVVWIPWAVPGMVLALGFFWGFIILPLPLYGTLWLMILVFIVRGLPIGTRVMNTTMVQISKELEECSRIHGASWLQTFRHIMLALLRPGFIAGWLMLVSMAVRDLESVILLYSANSRVLSTMVFNYWTSGLLQVGVVLGLLQALIVMAAYGAALLTSRGAPKA